MVSERMRRFLGGPETVAEITNDVCGRFALEYAVNAASAFDRASSSSLVRRGAT
jgi:hypothetical protein